MRNKLTDFNNYLFAQLERLDDESLVGEELDTEIKRGNAIADVAAQIIANANLQLKAVSTAYDVGIPVKCSALKTLTSGDDE